MSFETSVYVDKDLLTIVFRVIQAETTLTNLWRTQSHLVYMQAWNMTETVQLRRELQGLVLAGF